MPEPFLTIERYAPQHGSSHKVLWTLLLLVVPIIIIAAWVAIGLNIGTTQAAAGVNHFINYQGKIASSSGEALADSNYGFCFEFFDSQGPGGSSYGWSEDWTSLSPGGAIPVKQGIFSITLGKSAALPANIFYNDNVYLEVSFDANGDGSCEEVFSPRKQVTAAAYALNAEAVDGYMATTTATAGQLLVLDSLAGMTLHGVTTTGGVVNLMSTSGNAGLYYDPVNNHLGIGTSAPETQFNIVATDVAQTRFDMYVSGGAIGGSQVFYRTARGTPAAPLAIQSGDLINSFGALGYDGTQFVAGNRASIAFRAAGNWSTTSNGTYIALATTPEGSTIRMDRMIITDDGYVGIGTSSPARPLHVIGTGVINPAMFNYYSGSSTTALAGGPIAYRTARGTWDAPGAVQTDDVVIGIGAQSWNGEAWSTGGNKVAFVGYAAENWTTTSEGTYMTFRTTPVGSTTVSEKMRLTGEGKLGIGTNNPLVSLHVVDTGSNAALFDVYSGDTSTAIVFPSFSSRVARGTQSAPLALQTGDVLAALGAQGYNGSAYSTGGHKAYMAFFAAENWSTTNEGTYIAFGTTPIGTTTRAEMMRLSDTGNLGIGTTTPTQKLSVIGNAYISGTTTASCFTVDGVNCITGTGGGPSSGTVTYIDMTVPTGLFVSGGPITSSGTLAVTMDAGYEIPLSASITDWTTAFNWGNHASSGYLTLTSLSATGPLNYDSSTGIFSIPQANSTTDGYLSSADWNLFNTNTSGSSQWINGTSGAIYYNGGNVGIGTTTPNESLVVSGNINISAGSAYKYNGVNLAYGSTTLNNYFFGNAGNLTMTGNLNTAIGRAALLSNTTGQYNTAIGAQALKDNSEGIYNTAIGMDSLFKNTTGTNNTAVGPFTLMNNTTGNFNIAIGNNALYNNTVGNYNTAIGISALLSNTTGQYNTALGYLANVSTGTLTNATAIGYNALVATSNAMVLGNGSINVGIGTNAPTTKLEVVGVVSSTGLQVTNATITSLTIDTLNGLLWANNGVVTTTATSSLGFMATGTDYWVNTIGDTMTGALNINSVLTVSGNISSTAGYISVASTTLGYWLGGQRFMYTPGGSGSTSTAVGLGALQSNTIGTGNTALGYNALANSTSGYDNAAMGAQALARNTSGYFNTAQGSNALYENTIGSNNTAQGLAALYKNSSGNGNTAQGSAALYFNTTGQGNTAQGAAALGFNVDGEFNIAQGFNALHYSTSGDQNVSLGAYSLYNSQSGSSNVAVGPWSGAGNGATINEGSVIDDYMVFLGASASRDNSIPSTTRLTNSIAIGYSAKVATSNVMVLGGTGANAINVGIGTNAPTTKLEVIGTVSSTGLRVNGTATVSSLVLDTLNGLLYATNGVVAVTSSSGLLPSGTDGQLLVYNSGWQASSQIYVATSTGNVGIGTTTPGKRLTVAGNVYISGTTTASCFTMDGTNCITGGSSTSQWLNNGSNIYYSGGSVGIGVSAPSTALEVVGVVSSTDLRVSNATITSLTLNTAFNGLLWANNGVVTTTATSSLGFMATGTDLWVNTDGDNMTGNLSVDNDSHINVASSGLGYWLDGQRFISAPGGLSSSNTAIGVGALSANTAGINNTAIGLQALYSNTAGDGNTANGLQALYSNTAGDGNTANGLQALYSNTAGDGNTAHGMQALLNNTTGGYNTAIGLQALYSNTTGTNNTAIGASALFSNTTGLQNTAIGLQALFNNTTGDHNTANGMEALYFNTTGDDNTAIGLQALFNNTTGNYNTANGYYALRANTTGGYNTANGMQALFYNTTGNYNTANGMQALFNNTTGTNNTANGYFALRSNTTGTNNTANGSQALNYNTAGGYNTANGSQALFNNTAGGFNTANGYYALHSNTTGTNNTAIGVNALDSNITGNGNTALGYGADVSATNLTNATAIGYNASVATSNAMVLGDGSINVGIGTNAPTTELEVVGVVSSTGLQVNGNATTTGRLYVLNTSTMYDIIPGGTITNNVSNYSLGASTTRWKSIWAETVNIGTSTWSLNNGINGQLSFYNAAQGGGAEKLSILTSGIVSSTGLQVNGNVTVRDYINVLSTTSGYYLGGQKFIYTPNGSDNLAIGQDVLSSNTGSNNTAVGKVALSFNTTGGWNTAIGAYALYLNATGSNNTAIGVNALFSNRADNNTAIGYLTLQSNTTGNSNTAIGPQSLASNISGNDNTANGMQSLLNNTTGNSNTAIGRDSLYNNTTGNSNTALGASSLRFNTSGILNTAIGYGAGYVLRSGNQNIFIGSQSGDAISTGTNNIIIGYNADATSSVASNYLNIGDTIYGSLSTKYIGIGIITPSTALEVAGTVSSTNLQVKGNITSTNLQVNGDANINNSLSILNGNLSIGIYQMLSGTGAIGSVGTPWVNLFVTNVSTTNATTTKLSTTNFNFTDATGTDLSLVGDISLGRGGYYKYDGINMAYGSIFSGSYYFGNAGSGDTSAGQNVGVGSGALAVNTGIRNTAIGQGALNDNTSGGSNTAVGFFALSNNVGTGGTGVGNAAVGSAALGGNISGSYNTAMGFDAFYANTTGGYNSAFGPYAGYDDTINNNYFSKVDNDMLFLGAYASRDGSLVDSSTPLTNGIAIGYKARVGTSSAMALGGIGTDAVKVGIGVSVPLAQLHIYKATPDVGESMFLISKSGGNNLFRFSASGTAFASSDWHAGGADYAEYFYTNDTDLVAGEAVCVDIAKNNTIIRCTRTADDNIMGIISANPSIVGNSKEGYESNPNYKIVAMLGQIPANASTENGEIRPGDYLTAASVPGYIMKAGAGDATVGVALEGLSAGEGTINVMISRRNKSLTVEQVEDAVTQRIADMELEDEVNIMLADTIKNYDFTDDIASYINPFMASVDAKLTLLTDTLGLKVGELTSSTLGADNALSSQILAANDLISILNQESSTTASNLAVTSAKLEGLNTLVLANDARITTLELFTSSSVADLQAAIANLSVATSSDLQVEDDMLTVNTLVVTQSADFVGTITVRGEANFEAKVTFKKPVVLSADSAGTAMIKAGEKFVEVKFSESYEVEPKIVANLNNDDESIFIIYKIASKTKDGFKIVLAEPVEQDLNFDWLAFSATPEEATSTEALPEQQPVDPDEPVVIDPIISTNASSTEPAVTTPADDTPVEEDPVPSADAAIDPPATETPAEGSAAAPEAPAPEESSMPDAVAAN